MIASIPWLQSALIILFRNNKVKQLTCRTVMGELIGLEFSCYLSPAGKMWANRNQLQVVYARNCTYPVVSDTELYCLVHNFCFCLCATILLCHLLTVLCMIPIQTHFIIVRIYFFFLSFISDYQGIWNFGSSSHKPGCEKLFVFPV